jgi:Raf kinase inhibitor-like YbhB/YbcL family protein
VPIFKNAKFIIFLLVVIVVGYGLYLATIKDQKVSPKERFTNNSKKNMKIKSSAFENNADIPSKYSCDGQGVNPPLEFLEVPADAKSLALIVDDPDAPVTGGFVHWIVFNIDPETKEIAENGSPENAVEGTNSASETKFVSPCPPSGTHRYFFKIFALDEMLNLDSSAKRGDVEKAMAGHIIEQAELIGLYQRQ